ncbi:MAG: DUF547 domain-containing protein [Nevskiales bacterium]
MAKLKYLIGCLALLSLSAVAAPKADLWERWTAHDDKSAARIDHASWDALLKAYIVGDGGLNRFAYARVSNKDKQQLDAYINQLQSIAISQYNRAEQRAYWINLYNAATIQLVLRHYPVESITDIDISPGFFSSGPWGNKLLEVEGEAVSLDDIEHRILRPIWKDPLIHYSVNCASVGCPNLMKQAYTADNYSELAAINARAYINSDRGAVVEGGRLRVSSIYEWFQADFGGSDQAVIRHLKQYAEPELAGALDSVSKISKDFYDWSLNQPLNQSINEAK